MWGEGATRGLFPRGEELRRAVRWISEQRREDPRVSLADLVTEASRRFDLSPLEEQFLREDLVEEERGRLH